MEILYLLVPLSAGFVLLIIGVFAWALNRGQFEDLEGEGERILQPEPEAVDSDQGPRKGRAEQSLPSRN